MSRCVIFLLLLLFSFPSVALCDESGFYTGGQFGVNLIDSLDVEGPSGAFNLNLNGGEAASLLFGYDYADVHPEVAQGRVELELTWRKNRLDTVEFSSGELPGGGNLTTYGAMANFFYETHVLSPLLAYYGVGLGWVLTSLDNTTVSGISLVDDSDDAFAYQFGLGLGFKVTSGLTLDMGYRYFATADLEFVDSIGQEITTKLQEHTILIGARYLF